MTRVQARQWILAAALLAAGIASACGTGSKASVPAQTVTMRDVSFDPLTVRARVGEQTRIVFRNDGKQTHDFTVQEMPLTGSSMSGGMTMDHGGAPAAALHVALDAGKTGEVKFTPTKKGQYVYYCTVAGHREAGMQGTIDVE